MDKRAFEACQEASVLAERRVGVYLKTYDNEVMVNVKDEDIDLLITRYNFALEWMGEAIDSLTVDDVKRINEHINNNPLEWFMHITKDWTTLNRKQFTADVETSQIYTREFQMILFGSYDPKVLINVAPIISKLKQFGYLEEQTIRVDRPLGSQYTIKKQFLTTSAKAYKYTEKAKKNNFKPTEEENSNKNLFRATLRK